MAIEPIMYRGKAVDQMNPDEIRDAFLWLARRDPFLCEYDQMEDTEGDFVWVWPEGSNVRKVMDNRDNWAKD